MEKFVFGEVVNMHGLPWMVLGYAPHAFGSWSLETNSSTSFSHISVQAGGILLSCLGNYCDAPPGYIGSTLQSLKRWNFEKKED